MEKIKERLKKYFQKSSKWKIAGDIFFYAFIILMIIPATRKPITSTLIRITMRKPQVKEAENIPKLTTRDLTFAFEDFEGNLYSLEDFQDEVILLNFWATWCPPCRAEMPSIQKLYNEYGDKIAMILITSEEKSILRDYLEENNYDLPVYIQKTALTPSFPVQSIPTTFLIARDGSLLLKKTGAANWNSDDFKSKLDNLL